MGVIFQEPGKKTGEYIKKVKTLWDEKGLRVREVPSLILQSKYIKLNNLLTKMERREIENMIRDEIGKENGWNTEKIAVSKAEWNELFGELFPRNDKQEE